MYFEYLGIVNAVGKFISVNMTMFVGPFLSEEEREICLEQCHEIVSKGKTSPHQIKFIPCDQLPVQALDENYFEITDEGEIVSAEPLRWGATPPGQFLDFLEEKTTEKKWKRVVVLSHQSGFPQRCRYCGTVLTSGKHLIGLEIEHRGYKRQYIVANELPVAHCGIEVNTIHFFETAEAANQKCLEIRDCLKQQGVTDDLRLVDPENEFF